MTLRKKPFEYIVGKGEKAGNQHFLLYPPCFLTFGTENFKVLVIFILLYANALNSEWSESLSFNI